MDKYNNPYWVRIFNMLGSQVEERKKCTVQTNTPKGIYMYEVYESSKKIRRELLHYNRNFITIESQYLL